MELGSLLHLLIYSPFFGEIIFRFPSAFKPLKSGLSEATPAKGSLISDAQSSRQMDTPAQPHSEKDKDHVVYFASF